MWCCQDSPCTGKGEFDDYYGYWKGEEDDEGKPIGADCTGTALNLTQACEQDSLAIMTLCGTGDLEAPEFWRAKMNFPLQVKNMIKDLL